MLFPVFLTVRSNLNRFDNVMSTLFDTFVAVSRTLNFIGLQEALVLSFYFHFVRVGMAVVISQWWIVVKAHCRLSIPSSRKLV